MIGSVQQRRTGQMIARMVFALVIALALWLLRPGLPALPRSLAAPLTIDAVEGVALWLLWLIGALLALALLMKMRSSTTRPSISSLARSRGRATRSPLRPVGPRFESPSLVIVPHERPTTAPASQDDRLGAGERPSVVVDDLSQHVTAEAARPRICVLGPLTITGGKRSRRGLRARALELIAYLALHPRPVHRDELLEAFWPGEDPRRTRPRLRQAVRDARRLLGDAIASESEQYWLDRSQVDVDLDELERLLAQASAEPERAHALLEGALRLFRGEPLAGSDYGWGESELPRLRATFVDLLEQAGRRRLEAGEARSALELAERGMDVDALNESLWRLAMDAESALGLREALAKRYERLRSLLDERLGLEPAQETRVLHRRLLSQDPTRR